MFIGFACKFRNLMILAYPNESVVGKNPLSYQFFSLVALWRLRLRLGRKTDTRVDFFPITLSLGWVNIYITMSSRSNEPLFPTPSPKKTETLTTQSQQFITTQYK